MSKAEFLQELEKRLHVLNEKERQDVLGEYAQHIDLKIANGMSEEEAVKDFGSIEELIGELLDAYSINTEYAAGETKESAEKEKNIAQTVCRAAGETAEKAGNALQSAARTVGRAGTWLWQIVKRFFLFWWNLACTMWGGSCRLIRRLCGRPSPEEAQSQQYQEKEEKRRKQREKREERYEKQREAREVRCEKRRVQYEENREKRRELHEERAKGLRRPSLLHRFWDGCIRIVKLCTIWCVKLTFLICSAPFLLFGLFCLFCAGMLAVLMAQGYPVIGIGIIAFGLVLCSLGTSGILLSFVFGGKNGKKIRQEERSIRQKELDLEEQRIRLEERRIEEERMRREERREDEEKARSEEQARSAEKDSANQEERRTKESRARQESRGEEA